MMTLETFRKLVFEKPLIEQTFIDRVEVRSNPGCTRGLKDLIGLNLCAMFGGDILGWDLDTTFAGADVNPCIVTGLRVCTVESVHDTCAIEMRWANQRVVIRQNIGRFAAEENKELIRVFTIKPTVFLDEPMSICLHPTCDDAVKEIEKRDHEAFYVEVTVIGYELTRELAHTVRDWLASEKLS